MKLRAKLGELEDQIQEADYTDTRILAEILLSLIRCVRDLEAGTRAETEKLKESK